MLTFPLSLGSPITNVDLRLITVAVCVMVNVLTTPQLAVIVSVAVLDTPVLFGAMSACTSWFPVPLEGEMVIHTGTPVITHPEFDCMSNMLVVSPSLLTTSEDGVTTNSHADAVSSLDVNTYIWLYGSNTPIFCLLIPAMNRSLNQSRMPCIEISCIEFPATLNATPRLASVKNMSLPQTAKLSGL